MNLAAENVAECAQITVTPLDDDGVRMTTLVAFAAADCALLGERRVTIRARAGGVADAAKEIRFVVFPPWG